MQHHHPEMAEILKVEMNLQVGAVMQVMHLPRGLENQTSLRPYHHLLPVIRYPQLFFVLTQYVALQVAMLVAR